MENDPDGSERWTLVTVTHNSASHLRECWSTSDRGRARWLVVDNASADDSVAVARKLGAEVLSLRTNLGFSTANNIGLDQVETEWVAFVNPDVTLAGAGDLARLAKVAEKNRGFVAPQLLNRDGSEQPNARGLPYPLSKLAHRSLWMPGVDADSYARTGFDTPVYVAWAMGATLAGTAEDFRAIGGWDERYFLYYEDHDIGLRAWASGRPVVIDPRVRWRHSWQRETTGLRPTAWRHEIRSGVRFYAQYPALLSSRFATRSHKFASINDLLWQPASV